jgi:hypothetical protein
MLNPFGSNNDHGSYVNLQKRTLQRVQSSGINNQIFEAFRKAYEDAINVENIVLSRPERKRLASQVLRSVLEDLIKKLEDGSIGL